VAHVPGLLPEFATQERLRQLSWPGDAALMAVLGAMRLSLMSLLLYISRMEGDAVAGEPITHVWRMSAGRQAQFLLIALFAAGIGVFMGGGAILYSDYVIIGTIVIFAACIGATWSALQLRNSLTLTGDTLIVRTATKTHKIPFQQVTYVSAGAYGIYIRTSDGAALRVLSTMP
jgi:hypothetical protein